MSPFAQLLTEAQSILRARHRRDVGLHFDWDGHNGDDAWKCWADDPTLLNPATGPSGPYAIFTGVSGEQALRRLVDALKAAPT